MQYSEKKVTAQMRVGNWNAGHSSGCRSMKVDQAVLLGGVVLATRGNSAVISGETVIDFVLESPVTITESH